MPVWLIVVLSVVALWTLATLKKSRPDGTLVKRVHPYRTMLGYIMPTRNESVVYFDEYIEVDKMLAYMEDARDNLGCNITHCVVGAFMRAMVCNPTMNRFVAGRRLYDRDGIFITFSMKRQKLNRKAKLSAVKLELKPADTFKDLCDRVHGQINVERSGEKTYADKELGLLHRIPRPILRGGVSFLKFLDYFNCLPGSFIVNDAMFTSVFIANLGSVNMGPGYHHLFEWGTCPLFIMAGKIEDRPMVRDGEVKVVKTLHLRFTYDERIDDGLTAGDGIRTVKNVLEDPYAYLGCLKEDGSDHHPLDAQVDGLLPAHKRTSSTTPTAV